MQPLADLLRPTTLNEYIGQSHLVAAKAPLRQAIESGHLHSMILWGPPGCGKTTLAKIIASAAGGGDYCYLSAVSAKKDDIKKIIDSNHQILFLDEIHRFNKAQQDYLLPYLEDGTLTLIGVTTENPSFEVIGPLLSRCQVYVLKELTSDDLKNILALGVKTLKIKVDDSVLQFLAEFASGDARKALNILETAVSIHSGRSSLTLDDLQATIQSPYLRYDQTGDEHYNTISSYIKSMRASDPDAAIYYLARMIEAGEDPLFIARRMVIFASEDIGIAQPTALVVANEVFRACEIIGYPECAINLAHGTVYLATAKKDRRAYEALRLAQADVRQSGNLPIPLHLRNAPTKLMKALNYGKGYQMYPDHTQSLLPEKLKGKKYLK